MQVCSEVSLKAGGNRARTRQTREHSSVFFCEWKQSSEADTNNKGKKNKIRTVYTLILIFIYKYWCFHLGKNARAIDVIYAKVFLYQLSLRT